MSDGQSMVTNDLRRAKAMDAWLEALSWFACAPESVELREEVRQRARVIEDISSGYHDPQFTGFLRHTETVLAGLKDTELRTKTLSEIACRIGWRKFVVAEIFETLAREEGPAAQ